MRQAIRAGVLGIVVASSGCSTGIFSSGHDERSRYETGTDSWWSEQGALPPGVRRSWKNGKVWPARPRSDAPPQQFSHTFYAQHYWPLPYTCEDRAAVYGLMETQAALGWQGETTLYNRHFDGTTQKLTRAGELHLEYILRDVPVERRSVWVQSTFSEELDGVRLESVRTAISQRMKSVNEVPLAVRECREFGRPAAEVEVISDMYRNSTPAPRLGIGSGSMQTSQTGGNGRTGSAAGSTGGAGGSGGAGGGGMSNGSGRGGSGSGGVGSSGGGVGGGGGGFSASVGDSGGIQRN